MNKLICQVESCRYNEDCLCDLEKIKVEGPGAARMEQTCCASFAAKGGESASNSCGDHCASKDTSIGCKAENCKYNSHCKCTADEVKVGCCCPSPCVMSETECCTFSAR